MKPKPVLSPTFAGAFFIGGAVLAATGLARPALASSFSEPPVVVFGKVLQHGEGASYQLFRGQLALSIVSESDPANRVVLQAPLRQVGESGEHSFRLEVPQKHLPAAQDLVEHLRVGRAPESFRIESITVDGEPAEALDPLQAKFETAFTMRATEHRLDLRVAIAEPDADGDAMPDWWEDQFTLNRHSSSDAATDLDGDGLSNLEEFRGGTDPTVANTAPLVRTRRLVVPVGGTAGVALSIVDVDTGAADISIDVAGVPPGLTVLLHGDALPEGGAFTQADLLAGAVRLETAREFVGGVLQLAVTDGNGGGTGSVSVTVDAFSPQTGSGDQPVLWLDAGQLADGPVAEWADGSGSGRDAFQPDAGFQPEAFGGAVDFDGSCYLFVDMKELTLGSFSAFAALELAAHHADGQTVYRAAGAAFEVAGTTAGGKSRRLIATQPGRDTVGPALEVGQAAQFSMVGGAAGSFIRSQGSGFFPSADATGSLPPAFATIGGSQVISGPAAVAFLDGAIRELVIVPGALGPRERSRFEDYQRSRWEDAVVWDFRDETAPMALTAGGGGAPNLISGGWVDDRLTGGDGPDVLRGGPGNDILAGGRGGDSFAFGSDPGGNDEVVDFSRAEGDVIDLVDMFGDFDGVDPAACVRIRNRIVSVGGTSPTVDTVLELDHDGAGGDTDQTITLKGVAVGEDQLPVLLAEGSLLLGGPRYLTRVELLADATEFPALPTPHQIEVRRSGATDAAAVDIPLVFGGSLAVDEDYRVGGTAGQGPVQTVAFAAGETVRSITVTPRPDAFMGGTITIDVAAAPDLVAGDGASSLTLTLTEAARVQLATRSHAFRETGAAGVVAINRSGPLDEPLTLGVTLGGSAEAGVDYEPLSDSVTVPAGESSAEIRLVPAGTGAGDDASFRVAQLHLVLPEGSMIVADPASTDIVIFDALADAGGESLLAWKQREFPGDSDPSLAQRDPDGDGIINLWEYIHGTDPRVADLPGSVAPRIRIVDGRLQVELLSLADLTDVQVVIEGTSDLENWSAAAAGDLALTIEPATGPEPGRYRRVYRAAAPIEAAGTPAQRAFRFEAIEMPFVNP